MKNKPIESKHAVVEEELGDFTTDRSVIKISLIALGIGCMSALIAFVLLRLIAFFTNLCFFGRLSIAEATPQQSHLGPWIIVIPAIGGLVIGFMARYGSEKIRGHGIPEALEAILIGRSKIEPKVAVLKPLSSAISIGTGGPFGAEGPIIMTGGACGSLCAQFFHLSSAERKTLLVAGAAGGMSAVFGTPVAAVLLAVELLLFEWKPRSLVPVAFASIAASALRVPLLGQGPIFPVTPHAALGAVGLGLACVLGLLAGFGSGLLTNMVYGFEDLFPKIKLHWMWWPTIGGLFVGLGGYIDPRVLGVGYGTIHALLNGQILGVAALTLLVGKAVVWSASLGSGTSGGVLAPLLMMGGTMGALVGQWLPVGTPGLWAAVGMAAMMGGTMRSPFTAVVFTLELTNDIRITPALLIATIASEVVTVLLLKRSILTEKVARRGHHLTREYVVDPFEIHRVGEIMVREFATIDCDVLLKDLRRPDFADAAWFAERRALPIVDASNRLVGIITQGDMLNATEGTQEEPVTVLEAGSTDLVAVTEDDVLQEAVFKMLRKGVGQLPVVSSSDHERMIGYIDRASVMSARMKWYEEEHLRERHLGFGFANGKG
ncbi:chloride channel protein [Fimbriimonas ginsengisoli]|uniref:Chloride channel protein n=1 Tax=Fimbriimonas ginsengisoli Gsoil 348 TaxID=661478 RepID=A0A068NJI2_FIMGI|nr:chloride channel protein [Fimbriimonas ginsengisoli]AIE83778.1 Chloride channel protein [Fimbriimonas ginsengisoli Gsoil 348]